MLKPERQLLKHFLATLAYRTEKTLRQRPPEFENYRPAPGVRTPYQLLSHMNDVLHFALGQFGKTVERTPETDFDCAIEGFYEILQTLGKKLEDDTANGPDSARLLQGPFSDVMAHAGQLAMLRRLCGSPIPPENFHGANISSDNLTAAQAAATHPFGEWRDAEGNPQHP